MKLRVLIEKSGKSYTLNPDREYVVGRGEECDISLPSFSTISLQQLKFSYRPIEKVWYVKEMDGSNRTFANGSLVDYYPLASETRLSVSDSLVLVVVPDQASLSTASSSTKRFEPNLRPRDYMSSLKGAMERLPIINLGFRWFKIGSPEDGVGLRIPPFSLHQTYSLDCETVEHTSIDQICEKLYERVHQSVQKGTLGDAKVRPLIYRKSVLASEDSRKYILVSRDTVHGNRTTVFIRFFKYGENLYLGLDVYSLGGLSWWKLIKKLLITAVLSALAFTVIPLFIIPVLWWKLIWRFSYEKRIGLAFRQEFPGLIGNGPFDYDDVWMFSKSTVHLVVTTVRQVFKEENLPLDSLDAFIKEINNVTTINTGGGNISMTDSAIGTNNAVG